VTMNRSASPIVVACANRSHRRDSIDPDCGVSTEMKV
jgi:hypothetical protein